MPKTNAGTELPRLTQELKDKIGESLVLNSKRDGDDLVWTGKKNDRGYGYITVRWKDKDGKGQRIVMRVHRAAYAVYNGKWPEPDEDVHHICENASCIKRAHLAIRKAEEHSNARPKLTGYANQYGKRWIRSE